MARMSTKYSGRCRANLAPGRRLRMTRMRCFGVDRSRCSLWDGPVGPCGTFALLTVGRSLWSLWDGRVRALLGSISLVDFREGCPVAGVFYVF